MKNRFLGKAALLVMLIASLSGSGGTESHGTGGARDRDNVWFLGEEPAHYCIEVAPGSRFSTAEYRQITTEAFADWKAFFLHYGYDHKAIGLPKWNLGFADHQPRRLTLDFQEIPSCDKPAEQLRIVFSHKPPVAPSFETPSGFSLGAVIRGSYNYQTFRTGGIVWVHDGGRATGYDSRLIGVKHILLHELGHVFGMRHNEVWVMHESADDLTFARSSIAGPSYRPNIGKIETSDWKFRLEPGDQFRLPNFDWTRIGKSTPFDLFEELDAYLGVRTGPFQYLRFDGLASDGEKRFTLTLGKTRLKGSFGSNRISAKGNQAFGPSVFSRWQPMGTSDPIWRQPMLLSFEQQPMELPALGYFEYQGKILPAEIRASYGTVIRIFVPSAKNWLILYTGELRHGVRNIFDQ